MKLLGIEVALQMRSYETLQRARNEFRVYSKPPRNPLSINAAHESIWVGFCLEYLAAALPSNKNVHNNRDRTLSAFLRTVATLHLRRCHRSLYGS